MVNGYEAKVSSGTLSPLSPACGCRGDPAWRKGTRPTVSPEKAVCRVLGIFTSKALIGLAVWVQRSPYRPVSVSSSQQAGALIPPYRCALSALHRPHLSSALLRAGLAGCYPGLQRRPQGSEWLTDLVEAWKHLQLTCTIVGSRARDHMAT